MSDHILDRLYAVIDARKGADLQSSYTVKLLDEGPKKLARKLEKKPLRL